MSSGNESKVGRADTPNARHYYPRLGWLDGAPEGLVDGCDYTYAGTPDEPRGNRLISGDFIDIVYGNLTTQRQYAIDELSEVKYLRESSRDEITKIIDARLQALSHLAVRCLEGMGAERNKRTGINLMHYPGGPLLTDVNGGLWHRRSFEDSAE